MHEIPFEFIIVEKPSFLDVQPAPKLELRASQIVKSMRFFHIELWICDSSYH